MSMLDTTPACIAVAAAKIQSGLLVAFPTETVYGLGADATNESAARRIYEVKGRPPTDPLICHVPELSAVRPLWDASTDCAQRVADLGVALGSYFWPGPITVVARASAAVAPCVTGGSGYVGVRIPNHDVALEFLRQAGVPVAAPSANTFGHVSPTTARHVHDDLASRDSTLTILDGGCRCDVGIESTVVKLLDDGKSLEILRRGKIGVSDIVKAIHAMENGKWAGSVGISVRDNRSKFVKQTGSSTNEATSRTTPTVAERSVLSGEEPMDGPGQLLTHYSPNIPSYLVTPSSFSSSISTHHEPTPGAAFLQMPTQSDPRRVPMSSVVILDFQHVILNQLRRTGSLSLAVYEQCLSSEGAQLHVQQHAPEIAGYRSLSSSGCVEEASRAVFDALRWVETVPNASAAIFPMLSECVGISKDGDPNDAHRGYDASWLDMLAAVEDRLFRAASGQVADVVTEAISL